MHTQVKTKRHAKRASARATSDTPHEAAQSPIVTLHANLHRAKSGRFCARKPAPAAVPDTRASRESPFASGRAGSSLSVDSANVVLFQWLTRMDGDCGFKGSAPAAALPGSGRWPAASPADRAAAHSRTAGPPRGRTPASESSRRRPPHRPWFSGRSRAGP